MEANKILSANILDIIFEGKNKLYGAYQLRKSYNSTLLKAISFTVSVSLLLILVTLLLAKVEKLPVSINTGPEIELYKILEKAPIPPTAVIPTAPPTLKLNQVLASTPVIVPDNLVKPGDVIREITDNQTISNQTVNTDITAHIISGPITDLNSGVFEKPVVKSEPEIFTDVQIPAAFPGGLNAWTKYLQRNLDPQTPVNNGAPDGLYQVIVRFVVSIDGTISDVQPETNLGYGLEEEAIKIIKKGPKWIPASQNGHQVNAYRRQPIVFSVNGQL